MLLARLRADLVEAQKTNQIERRDTLRQLISAVGYAVKDQSNELDDKEIVMIIKKEIKIRREAIESLKNADRPEIIKQEQSQIEILLSYLPPQLSSQELDRLVERYLEDHPTQSNEIGRAIKDLLVIVEDRAESAEIVKTLKNKLG